jgi:hypothetical protein
MPCWRVLSVMAASRFVPSRGTVSFRTIVGSLLWFSVNILTEAIVLTALFSTCGISLLVFVVSAVLSLPTVFVNVYLGYALRLQADGSAFFRLHRAVLQTADKWAEATHTSDTVNYVDIGVSVAVTVLAGRYMRKLQNDAKPSVIYERRKRRQATPLGPSSCETGLAVPAPVRMSHIRSTSSLERSMECLPKQSIYTPMNEYPPSAPSSA